jgi:hypothetical protein
MPISEHVHNATPMTTVLKYDGFPCAHIAFGAPHKSGALYKSDAAIEAGASAQPTAVCFQMPPLPVSEVFLDGGAEDAEDGRGAAAGAGPKSFVELEVVHPELGFLVREIDNHTIQFIFRNRAQWFPAASDDINMQAVERAYKSLLIRRDDRLFLRLRLNLHNGQINTRVFEDRAPRAFDALRTGRQATAIVQLYGMTMHKGSIVPDLVVHSIRVSPQAPDRDSCLL